jgi:hypothetical protein
MPLRIPATAHRATIPSPIISEHPGVEAAL